MTSIVIHPLRCCAVPLIRIAFLLLIITTAAFTFGQSTAADPFTVVISTENPVVKSGAEINVRIALTNTSDKEMSVSGVVDSNTGLTRNYRFEIRGSDGKVLPKTAYPPPVLAPGKVAPPESVNNYSVTGLKPGETFVEDRSLIRAYDMETPDTYHIQLFRFVPGNPNHPGVKSNTITITVSL